MYLGVTVKIMTGRRLSNWLQGYLEYTNFTEAPEIFHFWTGISTIAGAMRNKTWTQMHAFKWIPNFYIVFVAPPGIAQKSTTMDLGHNLLRQIDGIHFGPDKITMASLVEELSKITTPVDLPDGELFPFSALTFSSSEFGSLLNPADQDMVNTLVDLWDGKDRSFKKATKSSGSDTVQNPYINLVGCCTPSWIELNFTSYLIGGGFASRAIFVYADKKRRYLAYPDEYYTSVNDKLKKDLLHDLRQIADITGPYVLTEEARVIGRSWYEQYCKILETKDPNSPETNQVSRLQTHAQKLAMVIAAAKRNERQILSEDLELAFKLTNAIVESNRGVFGKGTSEESRQANKVIDMVQARKKVALSTLYRELISQMPLRDFEQAVNAGIRAGIIRRIVEGSQVFLEVI